jgi:hypothetical protein
VSGLRFAQIDHGPIARQAICARSRADARALRQHDHAAQQTGSPHPDADAISWHENASRNEDDDEAA